MNKETESMKLNPIKPIQNFLKKHLFIVAFILGIAFVFLSKAGIEYTSSDKFCEACHVHPHSTISWKQGLHKDTKSGTVVHCVDCHLPPGGIAYLTEKTKVGIRDLWGTIFKDKSKIDWDLKSRREHAVKYTYKKSCIKCHQNLYSKGLTKKGEDAHLYYEQHADELRCINCHLEVGHYHDKPVEVVSVTDKKDLVYFYEPANVDSFINFTEKIPKSTVSFEMVAIPGGEFMLGSPESEPFREDDEGPQRHVRISSFWMGKAEVSWNEFEEFKKQASGEGRTEDQIISSKLNSEFDVVTGPTPAYGNPDQGWGKRKRPAITMTFYAAQKYCKWLSKVTGKHYRLPTEAEWEYAARGGTESAYFFEGNPKKYSKQRIWNKFFGADTSVINSYVVYNQNSQGKTQPPSFVKPNPFGLVNMLGNVKEFCSDYYSLKSYSSYQQNEIIINPTGPESGKEHVIRGGCFRNDAVKIRVADRDITHHDSWMLTDPQMPKSLWWYSDNNEVGFRVVCEFDK